MEPIRGEGEMQEQTGEGGIITSPGAARTQAPIASDRMPNEPPTSLAQARTATPPLTPPSAGASTPPYPLRGSAGRSRDAGARGGLEGSLAPVASVQTRDAIVTADANTNSIIVIAPPGVQQMYAGLIERLDERRRRCRSSAPS